MGRAAKVQSFFESAMTDFTEQLQYTRKKINEGTLEEWKRVMFEEIAEMRDLSIHTGVRRKQSDNTENK